MLKRCFTQSSRDWKELAVPIVEGDERWVRKPHNRTEKHHYTAMPRYRIEIYQNTETAVTNVFAAFIKTTDNHAFNIRKMTFTSVAITA